RWVASRDFRSIPAAVWLELVALDTRESGGQNLIPPVAIPIGDKNSMYQTFARVINNPPLPLSRPIVDQRHLLSIIRRFGSRADERGADHHRLAAPVNVRPAQAMRCWQPVDFLHAPKPARIAVVLQYRDDSEAVLRVHRKFMRQHDFWNTVAIN